MVVSVAGKNHLTSTRLHRSANSSSPASSPVLKMYCGQCDQLRPWTCRLVMLLRWRLLHHPGSGPAACCRCCCGLCLEPPSAAQSEGRRWSLTVPLARVSGHSSPHSKLPSGSPCRWAFWDTCSSCSIPGVSDSRPPWEPANLPAGRACLTSRFLGRHQQAAVQAHASKALNGRPWGLEVTICAIGFWRFRRCRSCSLA